MKNIKIWYLRVKRLRITKNIIVWIFLFLHILIRKIQCLRSFGFAISSKTFLIAIKEHLLLALERDGRFSRSSVPEMVYVSAFDAIMAIATPIRGFLIPLILIHTHTNTSSG